MSEQHSLGEWQPDRNLAMELVRATEAAAIRATPWVGRGDKNAADGAAVDAMRRFLSTVSMRGTVVIGEVGLTGEVRAIGQAEQRLLEARKMGFNRCVLPQSNLKRLPEVEGIQIDGVRSVSEAVEGLF